MIKTIQIVDEFDTPLRNAHVSIGDGGYTTNKDGVAHIYGLTGESVKISYVGMEPQTFSLKNLPSKITLKMESLDEVTVTAKKKSKTPSYIVPAIGAGLLLIALMSFGEETKEITL